MCRVLWLMIMLGLVLGEFSARAAGPPQRAIQIQGQAYSPLSDWAARRQLEWQWLKKDDEFRLAGKTTTLDFKITSQRAAINGIAVFLSFPLAVHNNEVFIAQKDIELLLTPILSPSKNPAGRKVRTIALSAGHGGKDTGFQLRGEQEKKYTLFLAKELQKQLLKAGFKVVLVRGTDQFIELEDRPRLAKRRGADLYLSLHYNSAGPQSSEVQGCEVYCLTLPGAASTNGGPNRGDIDPGHRHNERNIVLAYQIQRSMVRSLGANDRAVRRARFVVLRSADMPAVLIEAAFMSNPEEMRRIKDPKFRQRTAQAIVDGVLAYKRLVEP